MKIYARLFESWIADRLTAAMQGRSSGGKVQIVQPFITHTAANV